MKYNSNQKTGVIYRLFRYTGQNELLTSRNDEEQEYICWKIFGIRDHDQYGTNLSECLITRM